MMGWQVLASKININNMKIFNCPKCDKSVIETEEQLIICDGFCQQKFHRFCANLSIEQLRLLQISKNCVWRCNPCNTLYHKCLRYEMERSIMNKFDKNAEVNDMCFKEFNTRLNGVEILLNKNTSTAKANSPPSHQEQPYKIIFNRKAIIITGTIIVLTILIGILIITTSYIFNSSTHKSKLIGDGDDSRKNIPINSTIDNDNIGSGRILRIVPRDGWLAQPPSKPNVPLTLPVHRVIVISTRTDLCTTQAACTYRVRIIQTFNIESFGQDDIIYNFLIGGDGNVYEGRGWDFTAAHLKGFNDDSISFAYIGTFKKNKPSTKQMNVTQLLLEDGVRNGKLAPDYQIVSAYKLDPTSTRTLADGLYDSFKDWPHWSDN